MDIGTDPGVSAASASLQNPSSGQLQGQVQTQMLRKALDMQAATAAALIQTLPPPPPLASSGAVGTRINTYA
jgi:hypothetical protein